MPIAAAHGADGSWPAPAAASGPAPPVAPREAASRPSRRRPFDALADALGIRGIENEASNVALPDDSHGGELHAAMLETKASADDIIRRAALKFKVPYATTASGALAVCRAVAALREKPFAVQPIQDYHA